MTRKSGSTGLRTAFAAASWLAAALLAQTAGISDLTGGARQLERIIELRLKQAHDPPPEVQPQRTHEDAIEPWELVSV